MSAKDFHESRTTASGTSLPGEESSVIDLNVGTGVGATAKQVFPAARPQEGAVRTTEDGFRQVYRKAGGWAGELEEHPDSDDRIHLNGFSRRVSELTPEEHETAKAQVQERNQAFSGISAADLSKAGNVIDLDAGQGGSAKESESVPGSGKSKTNMVFDDLKGRMVRARNQPEPPKEQSYIERLASRHPSAGVSSGEGVPKYDRHPTEIRRVLDSHIKLVGDFLRKANANQGPYTYTDENGEQSPQVGFSDEHPLSAAADAAITHHLNAQESLQKARDMYRTNVPHAHELIRQAAVSIHKASRIINTPDFALAAGSFPDTSVSTTETGNNLAHAVVELESPRQSKLPKGVKLHEYLLDTADKNNQALINAFARRLASGQHPGVDRNLSHAVIRHFKRGTALGSEGWTSGDVTPTGFKGDILVNTKAATAETGTNPFGRTRRGKAADNKAESSASATTPRPQRAPAKAKPEETVTKTGRRSTPPTTARGKAAKAKRDQDAIDSTAAGAADSQLSDLQNEVSSVSTVRAEKKTTKRRKKDTNGMVFIAGPDGRPQVVNSEPAPKAKRYKRKTAAEIIAERRGN
jgi:hypothetical protein